MKNRNLSRYNYLILLVSTNHVFKKWTYSTRSTAAFTSGKGAQRISRLNERHGPAKPIILSHEIQFHPKILLDCQNKDKKAHGFRPDKAFLAHALGDLQIPSYL